MIDLARSGVSGKLGEAVRLCEVVAPRVGESIESVSRGIWYLQEGLHQGVYAR
ncbi:hypothetical protein BHM03_00006641 [Ensete ventricosum]|nr:hypothetical protein BHM03_00006641 [Ensete ventricosum]